MTTIQQGQMVLVRHPDEVWLGEVVNTLPGIPGWTRVRFDLAVMRDAAHQSRRLSGSTVRDVRTEKLVTA